MDSAAPATSEQEIAERSAAAMWAQDRLSPALGMEIVTVGPGTATLRMRVRGDMLNGVGTCHGGMIFSLADSAFAFACNSRNAVTVAQHCDVTFHAPGRAGEMLVAEAREVTRAGRSGLYDVSVARDDGTLVATFHGHSRTISGTLF